MSELIVTLNGDPHPTLVMRYRAARRTWADNPKVREATGVLGMGERAYCDRIVEQGGSITWSGTTSGPFYTPDYDKAFKEAAP